MHTHARLISMQDIVDGQYLEMIESCARQSYQASSDRFQQGLLWKRATIADGSESVVCTGKGDGLMRACWSRRGAGGSCAVPKSSCRMAPRCRGE